MQGAILYAPGDVRFEERANPAIIEPGDAVIRLSATCVCGSDLWSYRGINPVTEPIPTGHEYCGLVEEVGRYVSTIRPASSSSARSSPATTPARTAWPASRPRASTASPSSAPSRNGSASRSPMAPW